MRKVMANFPGRLHKAGEEYPILPLHPDVVQEKLREKAQEVGKRLAAQLKKKQKEREKGRATE